MRAPGDEPLLTDRDRAVWDAWTRAALEHSRTQSFRRRVERARVAVVEAVDYAQRIHSPRRPMFAWSGGKDSTVGAHLVGVEAGARGAVDFVSEKDDLDYPGERAYVEGLAAAWGLTLEVIAPPVSPKQWIADAAARGEIRAYDDIHSRAAGLSKACFYKLMEASNEGRALVFLGLRREESNRRDGVADHALFEAKQRRAAQAGRALPQKRDRPGARPARPVVDLAAGPTSGLTYWHAGASQWRCLPVAEFRGDTPSTHGLDVYAYAVSREIELLPVYRCVGLMHARAPGRVRKSWWLPGGHTATGQVAWLKRYYPSLFRQLCAWMPDATLFT